ncbi:MULTISPECIES: hypothetical protein [unclassified Agrobacterium]|uniref:hypothetical protein n=1 Tax=unclassified Agrobacterium TaxID=2632611 RepID=UPI001FCD3B3C|nr:MULTISPECIES: hypothetical protein [unclassified Agrobacterium]
MTGSIKTPKNRATAQNAARIRASTKLSHPVLLVFCKCVKLHIQLERKIMASKDSISGSSRSPADVRGDIQMPAQRKGSGCHAAAKAAFDGSPGQYALKAHPFQNRPAAGAFDPTSPIRASHTNFSKLYSELPAYRVKVNIEFHIDSTSARPPISTGYEMHQ